jgi:putative phage-type endonuclease
MTRAKNSGAIIEHTPEWFAARRQGITSTDVVAILGLSRYKSEGDVARDKAGAEPETPDAASARRMRIGTAVQDVIRAEEEEEHGIKLRRVKRLITHPDLPWAITSLDYERVGERTIVEVKSSASRDWDDGLPERVEAQVRWQMGVAGYPAAHVAALRYGSQLACFDVTHDDAVWANLLLVAENFRERLAAGGPFDETRESARRAYPFSDGTTIDADDDVIVAVRDLLSTREYIKAAERREDALVAAITTRMGPAEELIGVPGVKVTWRRASDTTQTNWQLVAEGVLARLTEQEREALISVQTETRPGSRRFVVRETSR